MLVTLKCPQKPDSSHKVLSDDIVKHTLYHIYLSYICSGYAAVCIWSESLNTMSHRWQLNACEYTYTCRAHHTWLTFTARVVTLYIKVMYIWHKDTYRLKSKWNYMFAKAATHLLGMVLDKHTHAISHSHPPRQRVLTLLGIQSLRARIANARGIANSCGETEWGENDEI